MIVSSVSIIVPTYNRGRFIVEAIESLLNQTMPASQLIVINDGSTDDTEVKLVPYIESNQITYLKVENGGKSKALNTAYQHVMGEFVWVFDDDDVVFPDTIERHMAVFEKYPEIGFTCSNFYNGVSDDKGNIIQQEERMLKKQPPKGAGDIFYDLLDVCFLSHCGSIVKKSCYEKIGLFDEQLIRSQDYDILLRLASNFKTAYVKKPTCIVRHHDGVRGSEKHLFKQVNTINVWAKYDRLIFTNIYEKTKLSMYAQDTNNTEWALLKRIKVMASRGLWHFVLSDLTLLKNTKKSLVDRPLSLESDYINVFGGIELARELAKSPLTLLKLVFKLFGLRKYSIAKYLLKSCYFRLNVYGKKRQLDGVCIYLLLCVAFVLPYLMSNKD